MRNESRQKCWRRKFYWGLIHHDGILFVCDKTGFSRKNEKNAFNFACKRKQHLYAQNMNCLRYFLSN